MSDLIEYEGGEVLANLEERTITGLLIPFNEDGRTNLGRFQVEANAIDLPADPSIVSLNTDHERNQVVGRATRLWQEPRGVMATFAIARTPEGDAALADATNPQGKRRKLSGEFGPAIIKAGKLVAGHARLWGSALVTAGAFPSAQVLAADTPETNLTAPAVTLDSRPFTPDENGDITIDAAELPTTVTVNPPEGDAVTYEPTAAPAEATTNPEGASTVTATVLAGAQAPATVPNTLGSATAQTLARPADLRQVFAAIANFKNDPTSMEARQVLAALTDIKISGSGALPAAGVLQTNWVGQLNQGVPYVREYITLGKLGTDITAAGKKGFKARRGTASTPLDKFDGTWAGNKAAVNSYNGFTTTVESTRRAFAIAEDIAREFYDLPGGLEVIEAFLRLIVEDYHRQSDEWALADWITAAGTPIAPTTASYPANYPGALGQLIQGILAVKMRKADGRRDVPTFAIANELAFAELAYAAGGDQNLPAFVNIAISTNSTGTVDGNVQIVQGSTGIADTSSVIVGANYAIEFDELAGGPLHIDALDIAKGGIDKAVHGYLQTFAVRTEAVVLVGTADAGA